MCTEEARILQNCMSKQHVYDEIEPDEMRELIVTLNSLPIIGRQIQDSLNSITARPLTSAIYKETHYIKGCLQTVLGRKGRCSTIKARKWWYW